MKKLGIEVDMYWILRVLAALIATGAGTIILGMIVYMIFPHLVKRADKTEKKDE